MSIPEQRFKDASGVQFMENGKIRCQAIAKSKMRKWREDYNDYDTPTEDLWPECQCAQAAEEGQYVCRYHGGLTPRRVNPPRTMLDVMPLDMAEKYKALMDDPDYISRKEDINLIRVRKMMLVEELNEKAGSQEAWAAVSEALVKLNKGDNLNAKLYLEEALQMVNDQKKTWEEIYRVENLLGNLTTIQVKTAKDLQSMATAEQVSALVMTLINLINSGAKNYIPDPTDRSQFTRTIVGEIQKLAGITPQKMLVDAKHADS